MSDKENKPLLNDPEVYPSEEVLKDVLCDAFPTYQKFMEVVVSEPYELSPEWRYYKDGKAWLCKVVRKKKTVHWLSIWPGYFKAGFYFTEKTGSGIGELLIPDELKEAYNAAKPIGKLKPLIIDVRTDEDLPICYEVVVYKMSKL